MSTGIVVLDNSSFHALARPEKLARFRANLRAADWIAQPSEVNLLESGATQSETVRRRLLATIGEIAGHPPLLLPWPFQLLQQIGRAIVEGEPIYSVPPSGKEWYLEDPAAATDIREEVLRFQRDLEMRSRALHATNRRKIQSKMRARGMKDSFGLAGAFLDEEWRGGELRRVFAEATWTHLQLPGVAPMKELENCEMWRLFLDAEGIPVYEQAVAAVQPKIVGRIDLLQFVYLSLAPRRMIVTADKGLLRAANAILPGRYSNARACSIAEMVN